MIRAESSRKQTVRKVLRKLRSPSDLRSYLRFKLVEGNEYLFFDIVDRLPALGSVLGRLLPARLEAQRPLFLAGLRRSGTTLLYRLIGAHPELFLYNERFPGDRLHGGGRPTRENIWSIEDPLCFRRTVLRYIGPLVRLRASRWGVKLALELAHPDPGSVSGPGLQRLMHDLPQAQVLGIVRDPRDFVLSALQRGGRDAEWWIAEYLALSELFCGLAREHPDRFTFVRYEDLVTALRETVERCCAFAGLTFVESMLDPTSWSVKGPKVYDRSGVSARCGKWREAQAEERRIVEEVSRRCFPQARGLGYRAEPGPAEESKGSGFQRAK